MDLSSWMTTLWSDNVISFILWFIIFSLFFFLSWCVSLELWICVELWTWAIRKGGESRRGRAIFFCFDLLLLFLFCFQFFFPVFMLVFLIPFSWHFKFFWNFPFFSFFIFLVFIFCTFKKFISIFFFFSSFFVGFLNTGFFGVF